MANSGFPTLLWKSFWNVQNVIVGLLALVVSVLSISAEAPGNLTLSFRSATGLVVAVVLVFSTLIRAAYDSHRAAQTILPPVLAARSGLTGLPERAILFLLSPSVLFSQDAAVSFYFNNDDGFELLIGLGAVMTIREDGRIQVALTHPTQGYDDILEKLRNNDSTVLKKLLVKPSLPQRYLTASGGSSINV